MDKKVSIITPCFNGDKFVARYLESLLNQTYKNIEVIFINDGSTDRTEEIVKSYIKKFEKNNMKLIYIYQENLGQAAALNNGLKIFTGDYLTWPDSDDILTKDSIEKKVKFLEQNKKYGLVRTDAFIVDENNIENIKGYFGKNNPNKYKEDLFMDFITENNVWFAPGCFMLRTDSFISVNSTREIYEGRGGQNWQMLLPVMRKYKCGYIDEPLYIYVVRDNSHSHSNMFLDDQLKRCDEHEQILFNTLKTIEKDTIKLKQYLDIVEKKYTKKRFNLACEFNSKELSYKYYSLLKKRGYSNTKDFIKYLGVTNWIFNIPYKVVKILKRRGTK